MGRIIPKFARWYLLICAVSQFLAYCLPRVLPRPGYLVEMATPLDALIVVSPPWVVIYVAAYLFWVWGYIAVCRQSPEICREFCHTDYISKAVTMLCFILLPTFLPRPEITGGGVFDWALRAIYAIDAPDNLFPSMHCSHSWLVARYVGKLPSFRLATKVFAYVFAVLVFLSTLFTGQHVIADIIGGVVLMEIVMLLARRIAGRKAGAVRI
jgi:membrane-associated phospholipid phosphatase